MLGFIWWYYIFAFITLYGILPGLVITQNIGRWLIPVFYNNCSLGIPCGATYGERQYCSANQVCLCPSPLLGLCECHAGAKCDAHPNHGTIYYVKEILCEGHSPCVEPTTEPATEKPISNDIATTILKLHMRKTWNDELNNPNSLQYRTLEEEIVLQLKNNLKLAKEKLVIRVVGFSEGSVIATTQLILTNLTSEERRKQCENTKAIAKQVESIQSLEIVSVQSQSLDCCLEDTIGDISFKGEYKYSKALESTTVIKNCSFSEKWNLDDAQFTRKCQGNMKEGPQWTSILLDNCPAKTKTTNDLIKLTKIAVCIDNQSVDCGTSSQIAKNLSSIVSQKNAITIWQDVSFISNVIKNILDAPTTFKINNNTKQSMEEIVEMTEDIIQTVSELIGSKRNIVTEAERLNKSASSILISLDEFGEKLGEVVNATNKTISINKTNAALFIKYTEPTHLNFKVTERESEGVHINMNSNEFPETEKSSLQEFGATGLSDSMKLFSCKIPLQVFQNTSKLVYSFFYKYDTLFQTKGDINKKQGPMLQSNVFAITVGKEKIENLVVPVTLRFRKILPHKSKENLDEESLCIFWDVITTTSMFGKWASKGCVRTGETNSFVECQCNHLTNFAVLLDVSQTQQSSLSLEIVTWVGCGISLAGLLATFITYIIFPNLRKKLPPKILMCLVVSLILLLVMFLAGVDAKNIQSYRGCQVVSGVIQYFMLTTFFWMAVEAVNLYRNFVKIFGIGSDKKFLRASFVFAWGIPFIVMVVCGSSSPDDFGNERFCVVHGNTFYYGVLLPVVVILLCNLIVLILVMRSLANSKRSSKFQKRKKDIKASIKIASICITLLGLTWVFGLFAVGDLREVFQWLFTIFNSFQGLFIFISYTLKNEDVRKEWRLLCCKLQHKNNDRSIVHPHGKSHTTLQMEDGNK